ncbi:hypothetical protein [Neobacillus sp. D3-1R]|uniref:hypothetical protein n=1 Tax=Neobacillus sp. D3-1R TaxID=3445778 RepID=UPI003FA09565
MLPQNGSETNVKLPFGFFLFSLIALVLSQLILVLNGVHFSNGEFRVPSLLSAAHFFILGWALMIAMGSMYQLVPVAFLTPIWSEKLGFIQFSVLSIGVTSFGACLYFAPQHALIPGILTIIGILLFLFQMLMTLKKQTKPNILTLFVGTGLISLLITILLGITLITSWKTGIFSGHYEAIFRTHLLLGVGGWFTLLIFGFSYKMVPMFSLSHGFTMNLAKYVYISYVSGLIINILGFFTGIDFLLKIGFFLLFIGFSLFAWHVSTIIKKRIKKKLDKPFMYSLSAIGFGILIHFILFISLFSQNANHLIGPLLFLYLMLWIVLSILGYLYKIVPFLWWTYKYSKDVGKKAVPALKDMINDKLVILFLTSFIISCFLIYIGFVMQIFTIVIVALILFAITIIAATINILQVILK